MTIKHLILSLAFLFLLYTNLSAKIYRVKTASEFSAAAAKVVAGDEIIIMNGQYSSWELVVDTKGRPGSPVKIRAETPGNVIFSGDVSKPVFLLTGLYTEISGITFSACNQVKNAEGNGVLVELKSTTNCRVTDCTFTGNISKSQFIPILVISGQGKNNRVDHCRFNKNVDNQEVQVKITKNDLPQNTLIDNNEFRDKEKVSWANGNGGECVQVGQDPILLGTQYSYTIVRENKFIACNGEPEVISNKSSGNSYIKNSFENCRGELVMRGGHDCRIDSNEFKAGSGGIRINGTNHIVTNNVLSGLPTGIRLMYGMSKGKEEIGFYVAPSECLIKDNKIMNCTTGILVGDSKNVDWTGKFDVKRYPSRTMQDVAPFNNQFADNKISETQTPVLDNTK